MSFFVREKTVSKNNKRFSSVKNNNTKTQKSKKDEDEELDSDFEEIHGDYKSHPDISDEEDEETPQAKRLRLAKKYLNELKESDDEEEVVTKKLKQDYLESIGKLKKYLADSVTGYDNDAIVTLKHKLQNQSITCLCLSTDEKFLFSGSKTGNILKWNISEKKHSGCIKLDSSVMCLALSSDFKFLAVSDKSNDIEIYNPETLKKLHTFDGHRETVTGLVFRKDSHQMFSCSEDRSVKVWSLDEMVYVETLFGHQSPITAIDALYKERALTSGGSDRTLRIWKIVDESQLVYNGHSGSIDCVKLVNEETFLSCGDDGTLAVWSVGKKKPSGERKFAHGKSSTAQPNWISAIATLVNTDLVASGSCDGFIRVWKLDKNFRDIKLKFEIPVVGFVNSLVFSSDGNNVNLIAGIGQEHKLGRWWRLKEGKNNILVIPLTMKVD